MKGRPYAISGLIFFLSMGLLSLPTRGGELASPETKLYFFKARTWDSISSSTDQLNGRYEVAVSNGKAEEVNTVTDGEKRLIGGNAAGEIARMVGIDPANRMYINPPLEVDKTWSQSYSYTIPGINRLWRRSVNYKVVSEETLTTPAGTFNVFKLEATSRTGDGTNQKWIYYYSKDIDCVVKWFYDSGVGIKGAKVEIELEKLEVR